MTGEQIRAIARLPPEQDFRFRRQYGKTIVVIPHEDGSETQIDEHGDFTFFSATGWTSWGQRTFQTLEGEEIT